MFIPSATATWHTDHKHYTEAGAERKDMRHTVNLVPIVFLREEVYFGLTEFRHSALEGRFCRCGRGKIFPFLLVSTATVRTTVTGNRVDTYKHTVSHRSQRACTLDLVPVHPAAVVTPHHRYCFSVPIKVIIMILNNYILV